MGAIVAVHVGSLTPVWPGPLTTGVPPGTVLTPHVGDITLSTPGQVLQNMHIQGQVAVAASGCTIRNCLIENWVNFAIVTELATGAPLLVEDCEIGPSSFTDGKADGATQIAFTNVNARRLNMHGAENGFSIDTGIIEDCYIHDMNNRGVDNHTDCIQTSEPHNLIIRHNRLESVGIGNDGTLTFGTSCIIFDRTATEHDCIVDNNLFAGGGFCLYGPQGVTGTNIQITNNRFSTQFYPNAGFFGAWTDAVDEDVVSNNRWFPDGRLVPDSGLFRDTI